MCAASATWCRSSHELDPTPAAAVAVIRARVRGRRRRRAHLYADPGRSQRAVRLPSATDGRFAAERLLRSAAAVELARAWRRRWIGGPDLGPQRPGVVFLAPGFEAAAARRTR